MAVAYIPLNQLCGILDSLEPFANGIPEPMGIFGRYDSISDNDQPSLSVLNGAESNGTSTNRPYSLSATIDGDDISSQKASGLGPRMETDQKQAHLSSDANSKLIRSKTISVAFIDSTQFGVYTDRTESPTSRNSEPMGISSGSLPASDTDQLCSSAHETLISKSDLLSADDGNDISSRNSADLGECNEFTAVDRVEPLTNGNSALLGILCGDRSAGDNGQPSSSAANDAASCGTSNGQPRSPSIAVGDDKSPRNPVGVVHQIETTEELDDFVVQNRLDSVAIGEFFLDQA